MDELAFQHRQDASYHLNKEILYKVDLQEPIQADCGLTLTHLVNCPHALFLADIEHSKFALTRKKVENVVSDLKLSKPIAPYRDLQL